MAEGHRGRLRKRLLNEDIDEIPEYVVLEMMLTGVIQRRDTCELARELIKEFGSFSSVVDAPYELLKSFPGMGEAAATHIKLLPMFYRKYRQAKWHEGGRNTVLKNNEHIKDFIVDKFIGCDKEELLIVCMDMNRRVIHVHRMARGTTTAVSISVNEVINVAVKYNSAYVILAHNHVSGNGLPSRMDCETTEILREALKSVDVILEDHLVVGDREYLSVMEFIRSYGR